MELKINIEGKILQVKAQSIWCKKEDNVYKLGICFLKMSHEDRREYVNYICDNILNFYLDEEGNIREI